MGVGLPKLAAAGIQACLRRWDSHLLLATRSGVGVGQWGYNHIFKDVPGGKKDWDGKSTWSWDVGCRNCKSPTTWCTQHGPLHIHVTQTEYLSYTNTVAFSDR